MMSVANYDESQVSPSQARVTTYRRNSSINHISDSSALNVLEDSQDGGSDDEANEELAFR